MIFPGGRHQHLPPHSPGGRVGGPPAAPVSPPRLAAGLGPRRNRPSRRPVGGRPRIHTLQLLPPVSVRRKPPRHG